MSPEDWQALSPKQRAENVAHTHEAGDPATPPATAPTTSPADPPATRDAAPQLGQPTADGGAGTEAIEPPPVRATAPILPSLDGPPHRAERPAAMGTPPAERSNGSPDRPTTPTRDASTPAAPKTIAAAPKTIAAAPRTSSPVDSPRTTVVAVEQLNRMTAGRPAARRAAERRARDEGTRAEEGRPSRADRRIEAAPRIDARSDAAASGRTPVRADEAPVIVAPAGEDRAATAWAALLAIVAAFAAVLLRGRRPDAPAVVAARVDPAVSGPQAAALDPVEAELQAMIAEPTATRPARQAAQEAGTGGESSTATNSA